MAFDKQSFNEVLKQRELRERAQRAQNEDEQMALDDAQRVKVLSPGRLVFKRFIRNRLAIVGTCILIFMFVFSFVGPLFYHYGQTQRFYKHEYQQGDYAGAQLRTEFTNYAYGGSEMDKEVARRVNSAIIAINSDEEAEATVINVASGNYLVEAAEDENIFVVTDCTQKDVASFIDTIEIGSFTTIEGKVTYNNGVKDLGGAFYEAAAAALKDRTYAFTFDGAADFQTAFTASGAMLCNIGTGAGTMGMFAEYHAFSQFSQLLMCFLMLAGRLEIYAVLLPFSRSFWKEKI